MISDNETLFRLHLAEATREFSGIDWMKTLEKAKQFFSHFYWPQKVGLVFVSGIPKRKLFRTLSVVCSTGNVRVKVKKNEKGDCAYAIYDNQLEGQLSILLLNGLVYGMGREIKVLPCLNLHTEKLPEALFSPVFDLEFQGDYSEEILSRLLKVFNILWLYYRKLNNIYISQNKDVITDVEECKKAINQIRSHRAKKVTLDCEGINFGADAQITLIQIATPQMSYIFDILEGGPELFEEGGLRELLEDKYITKITHDCRNDSKALLDGHDVRLKGAFDLQVAYAALTIQDNGSIPMPVSLTTMLSKFGDENFIKLKDFIKEKMTADPNFWTVRPLSAEMIEYAHQDAYQLHLIYKNMKNQFKAHTQNLIYHRSNLYACMWDVKPAVHNCTGFPLNIPLYNFSDWDKVLIQNMYKSTCNCEGGWKVLDHIIDNNHNTITFTNNQPNHFVHGNGANTANGVNGFHKLTLHTNMNKTNNFGPTSPPPFSTFSPQQQQQQQQQQQSPVNYQQPSNFAQPNFNQANNLGFNQVPHFSPNAASLYTPRRFTNLPLGDAISHQGPLSFGKIAADVYKLI